MAPVAWKDICTLEFMGGLGIRKADHFNNISLTKLVWKVITDKDNWWVQIVKQKYLRNESVFFTTKVNIHIPWHGWVS